jgi:hypothetical protein
MRSSLSVLFKQEEEEVVHHHNEQQDLEKH